MSEEVLAQELPDVLDRVEFGRIGRQGQQADIFGQPQPPSGLMPSGAIDGDDGVGTGLDGLSDRGEVVVHRLAADFGHDQSDAEITRGTDGAEDIGEVVALIADRGGTCAFQRPDIGQAALLADPGLILPPQFDRLGAGVLGDRLGDQAGEVFLCAAWASGSACG